MQLYHLILMALLLCWYQTIWAGAERPMLSLDQAVEMALTNHPALQMAKPAAEMMQAKIQGERAVLYPKLTARFVVPFVGTESGVTLQQHLWDFRQTQHRIEASRAQARATGFGQSIQHEDVVLSVKVAYYTVLIQQLVKMEVEHRARIQEKRLEQIESLVKVGRLARAELTQGRMKVDQVRLSLVTARHDVEYARLHLASAMGLETDLPYQLAPAMHHDHTDVDLNGVIQEALAHRSELRQGEARLDALQAYARAAKQSVYPTIFGRLAYRIEGEGAEQPGFVAGVGIQGTIFDGFATAAEVKEANAQLRHAEAQMAVQKQHIALEVKQAVLRLQLATEQIQVTQNARREAKAHLQVMNEQFKLGRISAIELAEAELLVISANAKRVQAIYNAKIALAQLERATGRDVGP